MFDAEEFYVKSVVHRSDFDDLDINPNPKGIALVFSNNKYAIDMYIAPCIPVIDGYNIDMDFDYQATDKHGYIDFDDYNHLGKLPINKYFLYIFNYHFNRNLIRYIYTRILLHSGFFNKNMKIHRVSIDEAHATPYTRYSHCALKFPREAFNVDVNGLLHIWKNQPNEYDSYNHKYRLMKSNKRPIISIHDYTTNILKMR